MVTPRLRIYVHDVDGKNIRLTDNIDINLVVTGDISDVAWTSEVKFEAFDIGHIATLVLKKDEPFEKNENLELVKTGTDIPTYDETLRPQLRFSQAKGWSNDPIGLVFHNNEYHMFWQHNPFGLTWNNMYWGHAVSTDLIHWKERRSALKSRIDAKGLCFSGSAYSNYDGRLILAFTDTQKGETLAYMEKDGFFKMFNFNPIIKHMGRDPKLIHYKNGSNEWWVIIVYEIAKQCDIQTLLHRGTAIDNVNTTSTSEEVLGFA
ncbi:MAG: hypothetical protein WD512_09120, partial [Candidatus Paceibacterota bacterium]